ncbi:uncharacterized protein PV09_05935 [Verruconis gallopava]|uniref:Enoyl reductase (ER) domain-containing protein n=1 Tax=Verruconis gallopava TaxID=253628 RepID=A0A0D2A8H3_9PEZI|nr:uncharacterized protein PV09_05935 [Verruconis gallopava]KIW02885.1 hypothetical protein PV09_05935 [Verruconis gallopava]
MVSMKDNIRAVVHDVTDHSLRLESQEVPIPSSNQYLIRTQAVGITKGELQWPEPGSLSRPIPGFDVAGTVIKSPSNESKFQSGDNIYALTAFGRPANAREITLVDEGEIASMPIGLSFEEAAAVPMSALTAKEALFDKFGLVCEANSAKNRDKSLLIIGASGAVGIWAVQLAKWSGVGRIVGMCGPDNVDFVKGIGAGSVINYRELSLADWVARGRSDAKFDFVLDGVGGPVLSDAWTAVKPNGHLLCIVHPIDGSRPEIGVSEGVKGTFFIVQPNGEHLARITTLIEEKVVRPFIDGVYTLDNFERAFNRAESGHAKGKVILKMQ